MPAYTHNRVYLGRNDLTFDYEGKIAEFTRFFSNKMTNDEAKTFFKQAQIKYVYLGPDTGKPPESIVTTLSNLKLVWQSGDNYIYQVM